MFRRRFNSLSHVKKKEVHSLSHVKKVQTFKAYFSKKKINSLRHKTTILWVHMKRFNKRVAFSEWVIFLKGSLRVNHIFKRVQFLESLFKNSILWVTSKRKGFNFFESFKKKKNVQFFKSYEKKKVQFFESYQKKRVQFFASYSRKSLQFFANYSRKMRFNSLRIIDENWGSILCVLFKKNERVQFFASLFKKKKRFNS